MYWTLILFGFHQVQSVMVRKLGLGDSGLGSGLITAL